MRDDQTLTIAEIASPAQIAEEHGLTISGAYRYQRNWPDACVDVGGRTFFVRERLAKRLAGTDLRPHHRKRQQPPSPTQGREVADVDQQ